MALANFKRNNDDLLDFDGYEKRLNDIREKQFIALEFYKSMVEYFKWENYSLKVGWSDDYPTLVVDGLTSSRVEFMFSNDNIIIHICRVPFTVPVNDGYIEAIKKIIKIFDYVVDNDSCSEGKA